MDAIEIIIRPVITEKATTVKEKQNKYTFIVAKEANKPQIKKAIEELFKVNVEKVRTARYAGKLKRMGAHSGYKSEYKKATVTLKSGQVIKIVEGA